MIKKCIYCGKWVRYNKYVYCTNCDDSLFIEAHFEELIHKDIIRKEIKEDK